MVGMSDPGCFPCKPREGAHSSTGRMPHPHSVWEPPLCDMVMSMCSHCDSVDSRGGLDGGSQERKAQEGQASHLEVPFPETVLSGLSDGWGSPWAGAHRKKGQDGPKTAERTLDWTWLWHSTSWASLPVPWTPSPRRRRILFCPHEGLLWLMQAMQVNFQGIPSIVPAKPVHR